MDCEVQACNISPFEWKRTAADEENKGEWQRQKLGGGNDHRELKRQEFCEGTLERCATLLSVHGVSEESAKEWKGDFDEYFHVGVCFWPSKGSQTK